VVHGNDVRSVVLYDRAETCGVTDDGAPMEGRSSMNISMIVKVSRGHGAST